MKVFKDEGEDSHFETIMSSINGDLYASSVIKFEGYHAENALRRIFNLDKLDRKDRLEIKSFKVLSLKTILNNLDMKDNEKIMMNKNTYTGKGIQMSVGMMLKKYCEADIFCMIMTKYYGSMFTFKLEGELSKIQKTLKMKNELQDIKFNERYMLDNCFLNLDIDFTDFEAPSLDVYISGDFVGEI